MSRLDAMILRLSAQRAAIAMAQREIVGLPGVVLEFGLGKGRTYDHLRACFPERDIFVFDRAVEAHPDCIPPADRLFLGEFRETAEKTLGRFRGAAILIHGDIGNGDRRQSHALAAHLAPLWAAMMCEGAVLLSDQPQSYAGLDVVDLPEPAHGTYFAYRRTYQARVEVASRNTASSALTTLTIRAANR
jgi:hypothetical protein